MRILDSGSRLWQLLASPGGTSTRQAARWLIALVALSLVVYAWYGSLRIPFYVRDAVIFLGAALLTLYLLWRRRRTDAGRPLLGSGWSTPLGAAAGTLLLAWLFTSAMDHALAKRAIEAQPERSTPRRPGPPLRVGLALSGGGHRAAVLHAGSMFQLARLGVPITNLSVVSGGSLIGTFYALGGRPEGFLDAETAGLFSVRREAGHLDSLVDYLPHRGIRRFTRIHSKVLDQRMLQGLTLAQWAKLAGGPRLMIGTTDLTTGDLLGVIPEGVLRCPISTLQSRVDALLRPGTSQPSTSRFMLAEDVGLAPRTHVADLLAASSAIPGVFPAVSFGDESVLSRLDLADGGVADNSGLRLLLEADFQARNLAAAGDLPQAATERDQRIAAYHERRRAAIQGWAVDLIVASDGGFAFLRATPPDALEQLGRSLSIMQANSSAAGLDRTEILRRFPGKIVLVTPNLLVPKLLGEQFLTRQTLKRQMLFRFQPVSPEAGARVASFAELGEAERAELAEVLPAPERERAKALLLAARRSRFDYRKPLSPYSRAPAPGREAFELVADDLAAGLLAFTRMSTVADRLDRGEAEKLFRLGRYLVLLKGRDIRAAVAAHRQSHASRPRGEDRR